MIPEDGNNDSASNQQLTHTAKKIIAPLTDMSTSQEGSVPSSEPLPFQPANVTADQPSLPPTDSAASVSSTNTAMSPETIATASEPVPFQPTNIVSDQLPPTPSMAATPYEEQAPAVFMSDGQPLSPALAQPLNNQPPVQSNITVGVMSSQSEPQPVANVMTKQANPKRRLIIAAASLVALGGIITGLYYGVYMSPSFIWKENLSNENIAYTRLINYANTATPTKANGATISGSFNISSDLLNASGTINIKSYKQDNSSSINLDYGTSTLAIEEKAITPPNSTSPDYYLKLTGIKSLASSYAPSLATNIDSLDGQWIEVDHNLVTDIKQQLLQNSSMAKSTISRSQIMATLKSLGQINKQYLFTSNAKTAVTKIISNDGFQTLNGQRTYEYTIGLNKNNTKNYLNALCTAVKNSPLGSYFANYSQQSVSQFFNCGSFADQANNIKPSDNFKAWVNVNNRVLQQIQVYGSSDPAGNYVALGYDYRGGNSFPFYLKGVSSSKGSNSNFSINGVIDTKANSATIGFKADTNSQNIPSKINGSIKLQPNNTPLNLVAPVSSIPLSQAISKLGLGISLPQLLGASQPTTSPVPMVPSQSVKSPII